MNLIYPRVVARLNGTEIPVVSCAVNESRYTRANDATLQTLREVALQAEPYMPVEIDMFYAHQPDLVASFKYYVIDAPARDGRIELKDKYFELGSPNYSTVATLRDIKLDQLVQEAASWAGILSVAAAAYDEVKEKYHVYRQTPRQIIEEACRDYGVNPLIYFDRDETLYFGLGRNAAPEEYQFKYGINITGKPRREIRTLDVDLIEGGGDDLWEQWLEDEQDEVRIPYHVLPVVFTPWIQPGDVVGVDHPDLSGSFNVVSATHSCRDYGTTLELEAS